METQFGPGWRDKALMGPLGVFPLRDVFEEAGLRDPREPDPRCVQAMALPMQVCPPLPVDTSPEASLRAGLSYIKARYGVRPDSGAGAWRAAVARGNYGDPGAAVRQPEPTQVKTSPGNGPGMDEGNT